MLTTAPASFAAALPASIPSPCEGVCAWHVGPIPIRAYALSILAGIVLAIWLGNRRWIARGGEPGVVGDIAIWAVPFGIVGGRLYHVATDWELYFGEGGDPLESLRIWEGGLGVWGAIALGGVGAWIGARRRGVPLPALADALAPGIVLAQAVGRWGNWTNQELFGRPTDLPWGLEIDPAFRPDRFADAETFHPTFLYEALWCFAAAGALLFIERRFKGRIRPGGLFALYVLLYSIGRFWIEMLRVDPSHELGGVRLNVYVAGIAILASAGFFVWWQRRWRRGGAGPPPKVETMAVPKGR